MYLKLKLELSLFAFTARALPEPVTLLLLLRFWPGNVRIPRPLLRFLQRSTSNSFGPTHLICHVKVPSISATSNPSYTCFSQPDHISCQGKNEKRFSMPEEKKGDWFSGARFSCRMSDPSSVGKALHRGVLGWARLHSSLSQSCRNREFSHRSRALLIILRLCPLTLPFTPLTLCEKLHQPASYFSLVAILVGSQTQYSSHYHQTPSQDLLVKNFDTFLPRQQQFTTPGPFLLRALPKDLPPRGSPQKPREEPPAGMSRLQQVLRRPEWSDQAPGGGGSRFILKEIRF